MVTNFRPSQDRRVGILLCSVFLRVSIFFYCDCFRVETDGYVPAHQCVVGVFNASHLRKGQPSAFCVQMPMLNMTPAKADASCGFCHCGVLLYMGTILWQGWDTSLP